MILNSKQDHIIIVGGGAFGLSTAWSLCTRGYTNITLLDQSPIPCPEAASTDINKIIRLDYGDDPVYTRLAFQSIQRWHEWNHDSRLRFGRNEPLFHQTGVVFFSKELKPSSFETKTVSYLSQFGESLSKERLKMNTSLGCSAPLTIPLTEIANNKYPDLIALRTAMPFGYVSSSSGWGNSELSIIYLYERILRDYPTQIRFHLGKDHAFDSFLYDERDRKTITGVKTRNGKSYQGIVILATGSWTPSLLPELKGILHSSAQPVIHFKIPEGKQVDLKMPVWAADVTSTGFYGFPPNKDGLMKVADHGPGYLYTERSNNNHSQISSHPVGMNVSLPFPKEAIKRFRSFLDTHLPITRDLPIASTRLCWYAESFDADFLICRVPDRGQNFILASGGSGHAFKFFPVLGDLVVDVLEENVDTETTRRFAWRTSSSSSGDSDDVNIASDGLRNVTSRQAKWLFDCEPATEEDLKPTTSSLNSLQRSHL